ncbi:MAG: hypothetical protein SRB2_01449 [Desulfobacteraceae bacterium Eth-SRB2]|nr:MAG: hypothetical protein SRB2_01449 [Desulfobacteraceae bacterium Eth-SRB2]
MITVIRAGVPECRSVGVLECWIFLLIGLSSTPILQHSSILHVDISRIATDISITNPLDLHPAIPDSPSKKIKNLTEKNTAGMMGLNFYSQKLCWV